MHRVVESVGSDIKNLKRGDKVIPAWMAECKKCPKCLRGKSNICDTLVYNWSNGFMPSDKKTTRFSKASNGMPINHFFGTSTFSQYTVCDEACVAKINPEADLSKVCLLGCGVPTGKRPLYLTCLLLIYKIYTLACTLFTHNYGVILS